MILEDFNADLSATRFHRQIVPPHNPGCKGEGGLRTKGYFKAAAAVNPDSEGTACRPLVTVITAVFNGEKDLEHAIRSVFRQTYDNVEYIIVDGGSGDATLDIIRTYEHAIDYWVSESDSGIYDAWNKGIRLATGEWIAFLGADDAYLERALESYVERIIALGNNGYDYISSQANLVSDHGSVRTTGIEWNWYTVRRYMNVAHVGALHHRRLFEKYGLYDTSYKVCGDYEFLLRPGSRLRAAYLNAVTVDMRIGGESDK